MSQSIQCECRCGLCCMFAVVEATKDDVKREPSISQRAEFLGFRKDVGPVWSLNSKHQGARGPCVFFDESATDGRVCSIYETRPDSCRAYDCDTGFAQQLKENGVL